MHVAVKDCAALTEIVNRLGVVDSNDASTTGPDNQERRSFPRHSVMLSGLVQVLKSCGEIMVFSVQIRNISQQGILLEFMDKGHVFAGMLNQIEGLSVAFMLDESMVTLECLPRRIVLDDPVEVGVEVSDETQARLSVQRFLM